MAREPIFLSREIPGVGMAGAMAARSDASKVYIGRKWSMSRDRHNLLTMSLDQDGRLVAEPSAFPDSAVSLPIGGRSSVTFIRLHPNERKLYVGTSVDFPSLRPPWPQPDRHALTVFDLDSAGNPTISAPRSYDVGNQYGSLSAIARHPTLNLLYLVGWGEGQIVVYETDFDGEPLTIRAQVPVGGIGKLDVAVSEGGERLYLGSYPDLLEVVELDSVTGLPTGNLQTFPAGRRAGAPADAYYLFHHTPQALYRRNGFESSTAPAPESWELEVWPLNPATGLPALPQPRSVPGFAGLAIVIDHVRRELCFAADATFTDALTGQARRYGTVVKSATLGAEGLPVGPPTPLTTSHRQQALMITVAAEGIPVVLTQPVEPEAGNAVSGYQLRVTLLDAVPVTEADVPLWLMPHGGGPRYADSNVGVGQPKIFQLDDDLKNKAGQVVLLVGVGLYAAAPPLDRLQLRLEIFHGRPGSGGTLLKDLTETVSGNVVALLVPGYENFEPTARESGIELLSTHAFRYLEQAHLVEVAGAERPRQFMVSCFHLMGAQGHADQLRMMAKAVSLLGVNTANAYWWPGLSPTTISEILSDYGLDRRSWAVYHPLQGFRRPDGSEPHTLPLSYFDFYLQTFADDVQEWANNLVAAIHSANGGSPADLVDLKLSDEPGWYYPQVVHLVTEDHEHLAAFHAFLRRRGLTPEFFERSTWDEVLPISGAVHAPIGDRRRYYWTTRFFAEAASAGHKLVSEAIERAFGHPLHIDVNWNNGISNWYTNAPNQRVANNPDVGPDSGMGLFDWFASGRSSAHTPWTEDWFQDRSAQTWSTYGDALRSVSILGTRSFGAYVVGKTIGQHPAGASYKILSLVGHGAKAVDIYTFGPHSLFGDGWSENLQMYGPLADALRLLGRAERLLYPGQPRRGKVALYTPSASALWDENLDTKSYAIEISYLHIALVHMGYTLDFVDDDDLSDEVLRTRGYTVLYVTSPNMTSRAMEVVARWVDNGGVLALTPGAATADEYNSPLNRLDELFGVATRSAVRARSFEERYYDDTATIHDARFGSAHVPVFGPTTPLTPTQKGAVVAATFRGGDAAIIVRDYGAGSAVFYGFFPGLQYANTPDDPAANPFPIDPRLFPAGWGTAERAIAVAPAVIAVTPKPVMVDKECVEACMLESEAGVAVVLLNWTNLPIGQLTVTIPDQHRFAQASSARGSAVHTGVDGPDLIVRIPLEHVDVLMLDRVVACNDNTTSSPPEDRR